MYNLPAELHSQIITTFIDYMVYASNAVQFYTPTIEFLYLSQWQLLLDTLEDLFRDIAVKPEVFTYRQLHMLVHVFVQTNVWTAVGENNFENTDNIVRKHKWSYVASSALVTRYAGFKSR